MKSISSVKRRSYYSVKVIKMIHPEFHNIMNHKTQFVIRQGLLYRKLQMGQKDQPSLQFVLPSEFRKQTPKGCQDEVGHLAIEQSVDLLTDRFYWSGMSSDMERHIKGCKRCLNFENKHQREELHPIMSPHQLKLVHIDFLTIESSKTG